MEMVSQHIFCFLVLLTSVMQLPILVDRTSLKFNAMRKEAKKISKEILIKSVQQCDDTSMNQSCCFPNLFLQKYVDACPDLFYILMNNSKVACSEKGDMNNISSMHETYSGEPFCSKTCPDNFQVWVDKSISFCMFCAGGCDFNVLARYSNDTKKDDSKESHKATIAIILSVIAITFCAIITAIYCLVKKMQRCRQSQERCKKSDHVKAVTGNADYVNIRLEVHSKQETTTNKSKVQINYENVGLDVKTERIGNYYGKDPTTKPKTVTEDLDETEQNNMGIQNNGYEMIDESTDEFSKEHYELQEDGKQYENIENEHSLYVNRQFLDDLNKPENLQNKNGCECLVESSAKYINAVDTSKIILDSCGTLNAVRTGTLIIGQVDNLTVKTYESGMHVEKD